MSEEKKERQAMLEDSLSPMWQTKFGDVTLEQVFEVTQAMLAKQGILISRAGFLKLSGIALITPRGMVTLAKLGVEIVGFQAIATNPVERRPKG